MEGARIPVSSKKVGEEIINDFKSILDADVIAHISFEVCETEKRKYEWAKIHGL